MTQNTKQQKNLSAEYSKIKMKNGTKPSSTSLEICVDFFSSFIF